MSPARILILGVLLYLLFKLFFWKKKESKSRKQGQRSDADQTVQDTLVEDCVCHTYIPRGQAQTVELKGVTYYFCGDQCRKKFLQSHSKN